jgi:topoisomerase IV subunit B
VRDSRTPWGNTTDDWAATVDQKHLTQIQELPAAYAPGGVDHLIFEVLAYAADDAHEHAIMAHCVCVVRYRIPGFSR